MDEATGKLKEGWGDLTGDESTQAEGRADQAKGKGRQALGGAKDALDDVKDGAKKLLPDMDRNTDLDRDQP
jgi:uncharacterized protein YjbJ (UPF0337 family)